MTLNPAEDWTLTFDCGCTVTFLGSCMHRASRMQCCPGHNGRDQVEARNEIGIEARRAHRRAVVAAQLQRELEKYP